MSFRKLLLAGAAMAASAAAISAPASASIIDRPHFKVLGVVIVWAAEDSTGTAMMATDFVIDDGAGGTDLIGGAANDGRTLVTGSLTPTADAASTAALGDVLNITDDNGNVETGIDGTAAFSAFSVDDNATLGGEALTYNSSFYVASNTDFGITGEVVASTVDGDFDLTDVLVGMDYTLTDAADATGFGGNNQDPGGAFAAPVVAGTATLDDLTTAQTLYTGAARTAGSVGSIVDQSVRFDIEYSLGAGGAYDLSMGAGAVEADVAYTVFVP